MLAKRSERAIKEGEKRKEERGKLRMLALVFSFLWLLCSRN
jgi:hypothetical protein